MPSPCLPFMRHQLVEEPPICSELRHPIALLTSPCCEPSQAVKAGGPEPDVNRSLFVLIREAKANGVPNDNIQRAIQRGSSASEADFKEAVYEVRSLAWIWEGGLMGMGGSVRWL